MSNELVRSGQKYLATNTDASLRKDAGRALVGVGAGGLVLSVLAGVIPFVNLSVLLILFVVLGGYLWAK
jgi:hypothetical protein